MSFEFEVPLTRDHLLQKSGVNQYVVDEVFAIRILPAKLKDCQAAFKCDGSKVITTCFDSFFSVLVHFNNLDAELKECYWQLLVKLVVSQSSVLVEILEHDMSNDERRDRLNNLKMGAYLLCQFIERFENAIVKPANTVTIAGGGKGSRKKTSVKVGGVGGIDDETIDWENERERAVKALLQLFQLGIARLWDPPIVEEEFVNMVTNICYKLLENPNVTRNKTVRDAIFHLLGIAVKRYNHTIGCTLKLLQLLQQYEQLASHCALAVQLFVESYGLKGIVAELLREIGRMDPKELARDTSGTRTYAAFLVELAKCIPSAILPNISVIVGLLDGESYTMRNSVLSVMAEVVIRVLSGDGLDAKQKSTRDQFLDKLEDHIHDVNAFVRSKVLQIWFMIVSEKALPLPRQHSLLQLVIGRLQDKSSQVRKNAVQLLTALVRINPLAAQLSVENLKENYEKEKQKLSEMMPASIAPPSSMVQAVLATRDENNTDEASGTVWKRLEPGVKKYLLKSLETSKSSNEENDEDDDDERESSKQITDDDTIDSVKARIKGQIVSGQFPAAVRLLRLAKETWPAHKLFENMVTSNATDTQESATEEDDDDDDNERQPKVKQLSKNLQSILDTLRQIHSGSPADVALVESHSDVEDTNGDKKMDVDNPNIINDISKQQVLVQYLKDSLNFVTEIHAAIPIVCQLLGSKTPTDTLEAIDFFVSCYEMGVRTCLVGVRKMLPLIWSREASIKAAVTDAYKRVYLDPKVTNPRTKALAVAASLISLTIGATLGDLTSLDELVQEFVRTEELGSRVIQVLWEKFALKLPNTSVSESRGALVLLGMVAGACIDTVRSNIDTLISEGLGPRAEDDFLLARDTCTAFIKLTAKPKGQVAVDTLHKPVRFEQDHTLFIRLSHLLVTGLTRLDRPNWVPMCEQAVALIYKLAEHPDIICGEIIKLQAKAILGSCQSNTAPDINADTPLEEIQTGQSQDSPAGATSSTALMRFIFMCGHVAFHELIHLDVAIFDEMKRRHAVKEENAMTNRGGGRESVAPSRAASTVRGTKMGTVRSGGTGGNDAASVEEEMGLAGAAAEDAEAEFIRRITESDIVTGRANLLAVLCPLIVAVCNNQSRFTDPDLRAAATLALAKYMIVSSEFCEEHLPLLFTLLEKSPHPAVRANTIVALGDLTFRFPNLIEPWTANIYARLRDDSIQVRKNTLLVLTHLILNDMIKVKGQISELATCVIDDNPQISGLAKLFFQDLSGKGNAIYNILPDVISRLSDVDVGVSEDNFRTILKYLMSFIQKDRQCESIVEKLCHRFRATNVERHWRDLAYCLSLLQYNDKAVRKLSENFGCYSDKLSEDFVYDCLTTVIGAAKKFPKPEAKVLVDELEQRIEQARNKGMEEDDVTQKANKASTAAAKGKQRDAGGGKSAKKPAAGRKGRGGHKGARKNSDTDDEDGDDDEDEPAATGPRAMARRGNSKEAAGKKKPILELSSDEDDDFALPPVKSAPTARFPVKGSFKTACVNSDSSDDPSESPPSIITKKTKSVCNRATAKVAPSRNVRKK